MNIKSFYIFLLVSFIFSCKADKSTYTFQISGNFKNYSDQAILLQNGEAEEATTILIAEKKQGNFIFISEKKMPVGRYFIKIDNEPDRIPIIIDNTDFSVVINPNNLSKSYTIGNSNLQKKYSNFLVGSDNTNNLFEYQKRFIIENSDSFLGALVLKDLLGPTQWRLKQSLILYEQLNSSIQYSELGKEINDYITKGFENIMETVDPEVDEFENYSEKNTSKDLIDTESKPISKNETTTVSKAKLASNPTQPIQFEYVPYFYGDGIDGTEVSAKDVFSKNKLTLIDFWASWCVPCRAQNPDYVRLYNKYHSQGFEILSIASDKETADWRNAIVMDNMNWSHVIDPYNRIANSYNVNAIPHAILVNNQGGILAKEPGISRLENLLRENLSE